MPIERVFAKIVGRRLVEYQEAHRLSDHSVGRLVRVSQPYWTRVRRGVREPAADGTSGVGELLISALAVVLPDLLHASIDEVQELKAVEIERLRASGRPVPGDVGVADERFAAPLV